MIKKLRRKFILVAELSIFALLATILIGINSVNFSIVADRADEVLISLAEEGGSFRREEQLPPDIQNQSGQGEQFVPGESEPFQGGDRGQGRPDSPEMRASMRYFTVVFDENDNATIPTRGLEMATFTSEEAIAWARNLLGKKGGWTNTYYRFLNYEVASEPNNRYVSVVDVTRELSPSYNVLYASLIGSAFGLAVSLLVLIFVSKQFVKPLEESDKKQRRFISDASHELKTPLTIISANAELLSMEIGENESIATIEKEVARLTEMIRDLNDLARLEEQEQPVTDKIDLSLIAEETMNSFRPALEKKNIAVNMDIPDSLILMQNEANLRKLLSIIIENACKYALTHLDFKIKKEESRISIRMQNDAESIPDGPLDRVFERFYRSDFARASSAEGSGIGLSVAKAIVTQIKGRIYAKGKDGEFILKIEL